VVGVGLAGRVFCPLTTPPQPETKPAGTSMPASRSARPPRIPASRKCTDHPIRFSIRVTHIIESSPHSACATEYNHRKSGDTDWKSNLGTGIPTVRKDYQNPVFFIQARPRPRLSKFTTLAAIVGCKKGGLGPAFSRQWVEFSTAREL
jgi:hypothetical protein